jgi:hypothetical protein
MNLGVKRLQQTLDRGRTLYLVWKASARMRIESVARGRQCAREG